MNIKVHVVESFTSKKGYHISKCVQDGRKVVTLISKGELPVGKVVEVAVKEPETYFVI